MSRTDREFDLILWGATGFTGQLVAEHLVAHYGSGSLRWALGGRNESKLTVVRERLGAPEIPLVLGDANDGGSVQSLAERTRVVCTAAGPYVRYGTPLVEACAVAGTDYCDITGEVQWIRRMLDTYHAKARSTGARIVPTCGFDSIPSDLGVLFLQHGMRSRYGAPSPRVKCGVAAFRGGASGGSLASLLAMMEEVESDASVRRVLADPYAINPDDGRLGPDGPDRRSPRYDPEFGQWTAPFLMAPINTRVVRRSAALLPDVYGPEFRYQESTLMGRGPVAAAKSWAVAAGLTAGMGAMAISPIRRLIAPRLPQPGEGPTPEVQEAGHWDLRFFAEPPGVAGAGPLRARLTGDRDPGYGSTSKMLAESAACLALDPLQAEGGFHTPASAMGNVLIERLRTRAGVTFELLE